MANYKIALSAVVFEALMPLPGCATSLSMFPLTSTSTIAICAAKCCKLLRRCAGRSNRRHCLWRIFVMRNSRNRRYFCGLAVLWAFSCLPSDGRPQARRLLRRDPGELVVVAAVPRDAHELV